MSDSKNETKKVSIYITKSETSPVRLTVNGYTTVIMTETDQLVDPFFLPALNDANVEFRYTNPEDAPKDKDLETTILPQNKNMTTHNMDNGGSDIAADEAVPGAGARSGPGPDGMNAGQSDKLGDGSKKGDSGEGNDADDGDFDADALINQTIPEFDKALEAKQLTPAQLEKLRDAENDREVPRAGILNSIDKALSAQS
jgi:hypothetical protein